MMTGDRKKDVGEVIGEKKSDMITLHRTHPFS